jgi:hypothetical protein
MRSMHRQKGVTAIGWLIILGLIGFFTLLTLKMAPAYMEYYKVVSSLESLEEEPGLQTPADIRRLLNRRFNISYVESINEHESREHLFGNVYVVMAFNKQVQVRRN